MNLPAELARMTALFQLRTIATAMGANPDSVDAGTLTLRIATTPPSSPRNGSGHGATPASEAA